MSEQENDSIIIKSTRFGELSVPNDAVIEFPTGIIGFPRATKFVLFDHKPPFSWLHSAEDPSLAFVVVDGFEFAKQLDLPPPINDRECDLKEDDEYAILVIVTVRPDPTLTTANIKAPLFVNLRNKKGVQIIYDDPRYSTRAALWQEPVEGEAKDSTKKDKTK